MSRYRGQSAASSLLETVGSWGITLGSLAIVIAVAYISFGLVFSDDSLFGAGTSASKVSAREYPLIYRNLTLACQLLTVGAVVLIVCSLLRHWMFYETGLVLLIVGVALAVGMPYLVHYFAEGYSGKVRQSTETLLIGRFILTGLMFIAPGGLQLLAHTIWLIASRAGSRKSLVTDVSEGAFAQRRLEKQDQFMGPCWTLPFCRDSVKRVCPILHSRRPCWRDGRGCYCDQGIVLTLSGERGGRVPTRSAQGFVSIQSVAQARPKTKAEKRAQCLGCPIYLHRQGQKYRVLAPLSILAVIGLIVLSANWISQTYPRVVLAVGAALRGFSFSSPGAAAAEVPEWARDLAAQTAMQWIIVVVVGMLLVGYLIHSVEWALYKLGI